MILLDFSFCIGEKIAINWNMMGSIKNFLSTMLLKNGYNWLIIYCSSLYWFKKSCILHSIFCTVINIQVYFLHIVAHIRRLFETGIGLTTGFIGSHTVAHNYSVYALTAHYSSL
jgi:hypothetical protein